MALGANPEQDLELRKLAEAFTFQALQIFQQDGEFARKLQRVNANAALNRVYPPFEHALKIPLPLEVKRRFGTRQKTLAIIIHNGTRHEGYQGTFNPRAGITLLLKDGEALWSLHYPLVHELIHFFDWLRRQDKDPIAYVRSGRLGASTHAYLNNPVEFNAWFQQGAAETENILSSIAQRARRLNDRSALEQRLSSFEVFFEHAIEDSERFRALHDFLTEDYRKRFLARMFQLYESFRSRYL